MYLEIPYDKTSLPLSLPGEKIKAVIRCSPVVADGSSETDLLKQALSHPLGSPKLEVLAKNAKKAVILTSDHTRPVPSAKTLPLMVESLRNGNSDIQITILVATGAHRATTVPEMEQKFGKAFVEQEHFEIHDAYHSEMTELGETPSGNLIRINKIAAEADLLLADGFIEPHFFAGFSGGRKSLLPGVACAETIAYNHCAENINHPKARTGILDGNPIHEEMELAAEMAGLKFILNVILDDEKRIVAAFAGDTREAHRKACEYSASLFCCKKVPADIVITSNGGYPLDQNLYQSVKSMTAAESCVNQGGVIICAACCSDGGGGELFEQWLTKGLSPADLISEMMKVPPAKTTPDQWQSQILARVMSKATIIMICDEKVYGMVERMGMRHARDLDEAIEKAYAISGSTDSLVVIPNGISVIIEE